MDNVAFLFVLSLYVTLAGLFVYGLVWAASNAHWFWFVIGFLFPPVGVITGIVGVFA